MRPLTIGVSATFMASGGGFANAGISRYTRNVVAALARIGTADQWEVLLNTGCDTPSEWEGLDNVRVHRTVPESRVRRALWESSYSGPFARGTMCDVWFATAHSVPGRMDVPRLVFLHDMIPFRVPGSHEGLHGRYLRWVLRKCARAADRVLTNSQVSRRDIAEIAGVSAEKILVTPLGPGSAIVPVDPARVDLRGMGVRFDDFFLSLGTLEPRKNIPMLFEAMAVLRDRGELGDRGLVVAGGKGWGGDEIARTLDRLGLADRVHFAGYVPDADLPRLMATCRAFVYPSLYEGYGMPVLEAMLAGAPVLTSRGTAMEEVGGNAATYFDPRSATSVADAMAETMRPDWDRAAAAARGFERAAPFTWERCAQATYDAIREAVEK